MLVDLIPYVYKMQYVVKQLLGVPAFLATDAAVASSLQLFDVARRNQDVAA